MTTGITNATHAYLYVSSVIPLPPSTRHTRNLDNPSTWARSAANESCRSEAVSHGFVSGKQTLVDRLDWRTSSKLWLKNAIPVCRAPSHTQAFGLRSCSFTSIDFLDKERIDFGAMYCKTNVTKWRCPVQVDFLQSSWTGLLPSVMKEDRDALRMTPTARGFCCRYLRTHHHPGEDLSPSPLSKRSQRDWRP